MREVGVVLHLSLEVREVGVVLHLSLELREVGVCLVAEIPEHHSAASRSHNHY